MLTRPQAAAFIIAILTLSLVTLAPQTVAAQGGKSEKKPARKLDRAKLQEAQALIKLVDQVAAGQPGPADLQMTVEHDFIRSRDGGTYVPFTMIFEPAQVTSPSLAVYVRVVEPGAPAPEAGRLRLQPPDQGEDERDKRARPEYPFEEIYFADAKPTPGQPLRISRYFMVPGGEYDVYLAVRERPASKQAAAKTLVHKQRATLPDFSKGELSTSSVMLIERVDPLSGPPSDEQQEDQPYAFGSVQVVPVRDHDYGKGEELSMLFVIYNFTVDPAQKPNMTVEYNFFYRNTPDGEEKYFNKTQPQAFNAQTPEQSNPTAGMTAGQSVPLKMFPEGDYRLEIKITDALAGKSITRDVKFKVVA